MKHRQRAKNLVVDLWSYEKQAKAEGYCRVAGIDEAGRGPLAGPVVAAVCLLPEGIDLSGIKDSKKLTATHREFFYEQLLSRPDVEIGVGIVDNLIIDEINILEATKLAMTQAVAQLKNSPDYLLVDGLKLAHPLPSQKIIKGDNLSISIMAAAVIAKVTRDNLMKKLDELFPWYGFKKHKGYGTAEHLRALEEHGPCACHRYTFAPIRKT